MTDAKPGVVVLLSGGLDSTVALFWARQMYGRDRLKALYVYYSQPHDEAERASAVQVASSAGVPLEIVWAPQAFGRGGLLAGGFDDARAAVVPMRNAIFLAVAASHALAWWPAATEVRLVMGCCLADATAFPDCGAEFLRAQEAALSAAGWHVRLDAPLLDQTKAGILELATWLGCLPQAQGSWSCYRGEKTGPCGRCSACLARAEGFRVLGVADLSAYPGVSGGDPAREAALARLLRRGPSLNGPASARRAARDGVVLQRRPLGFSRPARRSA